MHENKHSVNNTFSGESQSVSELINRIAAPMREKAFKNPLLNQEQLNAAVASGEFSQTFRATKTIILHVILTISPSDDEKGLPFWHCSMSLIGASSSRAKVVDLWTANERRAVCGILPLFFSEVGEKSSEGFMQTKTAVHCYRNLTAAEFLSVRDNESIKK